MKSTPNQGRARGRRGGLAALVSLVLVGLLSGARAEGAPWRIGMSGALTGPAQGLGLGMKAGIEAYFRLVNQAGGVHGRPMELLALDDAYEPGRTGPNMRRLIDVEHAFAILGNPGTPTAAVAVPIANEKKVPFFGPFTGAGLLRKNPPDRFVVNLRASYAQETAEMVRGMVEDLGIAPANIAFFTQNDAFGDSGYDGGIAALKAHGYADAERLPHGRYPRNTVDVEGGLARLLDPTAHPQAVIMVGAYKPCAKFIKLAKQKGLRAIFANVSFVIGDALNRELGGAGDGVVVTQVVPPYDADLPAVREYRAAIDPKDMSFVSLEGFVAAKAFVETLRRAGPGATPESFIAALEDGHPFDLGLGVTHALSPTQHQFSSRIWPTVLRGGKFHFMASWRELRHFAGGTP